MPPESFDMAFSMRIPRVSASLPDVTQQIHSLRARGVVASHVVLAFGLEKTAFFKSAGSLWGRVDMACIIAIFCTAWYDRSMQKTATRIFISASIVFGVAGILMLFTMPADGVDAHASPFNQMMMKLMFTAVFVILPSFAISLASKYLSNK